MKEANRGGNTESYNSTDSIPFAVILSPTIFFASAALY